MRTDYLPFLFLLIAAVFAIVAYRNRTSAEGTPNPAVKTWLRIAVTFAVVGVGLCVMRLVLK